MSSTYPNLYADDGQLSVVVAARALVEAIRKQEILLKISDCFAENDVLNPSHRQWVVFQASGDVNRALDNEVESLVREQFDASSLRDEHRQVANFALKTGLIAGSVGGVAIVTAVLFPNFASYFNFVFAVCGTSMSAIQLTGSMVHGVRSWLVRRSVNGISQRREAAMSVQEQVANEVSQEAERFLALPVDEIDQALNNAAVEVKVILEEFRGAFQAFYDSCVRGWTSLDSRTYKFMKGVMDSEMLEVDGQVDQLPDATVRGVAEKLFAASTYRGGPLYFEPPSGQILLPVLPSIGHQTAPSEG